MFHNVNTKLITVLMIIILLNTYVVKIEIVNVIVMFIGLGVLAYSNRKILKELSIWQNLGILILFAGTVALLAGFFYFVASPIVDLISIGWIRYIVMVAIIIGTLIPAIGLLYKGMSRITNGKFPVMDTELETEDIEYPTNEEVQQLVNSEKVVEAVKLSRKLYGYSLLEAKRYVDSLR